MSTVVFQRRGYEFVVRFRYDPDLVEVIKSLVPSYARSWNPALKEWRVDADFAFPLADTIRRSGYTVLGLEPPKPPPTYGRSADPADWAHLLFKRVGPHRSTAVYRALSRCLHPDVGGETELQKELNTAFAELPEARRKTA